MKVLSSLLGWLGLSSSSHDDDKTAKRSKKSVCVIGAGASGLVTAKELLDEGHHVESFEATAFVGGAFSIGADKSSANRSYQSLYLTISNNYMAFSDFPPKDDWKFWTGDEYAQYLLDYARAFNLERVITFKTRVVLVEPKKDGGYYVTTECVESGVRTKREFDAVAVSIGSHQKPNLPCIDDLDKFEGTVDHSFNFYSNVEKYRNKKVVVVGIGESGADLVREISEVASSCNLVVRKYPFCIPRMLADGHPNDSFTCRLFYPNRDDSFFVWFFVLVIFVFIWVPLSFTRWAYPYQQWKGQSPVPLDVAGKSLDCMGAPRALGWMDQNTPRTEELVRLLASWHAKENSSWVNKSVSKNISFLPNVLNGKINVIRGVIASVVAPRRIRLQDGTELDCDALVFCTGYCDEFSFLAPELRPPKNDVRQLFYHSIHPDIGPSLCFVGMARPTSGAIPGCSELVARYFSLLVSGRRQLPSNVKELAVQYAKREDEIFYNSPSIRALVNPFDFFDGIAKLIGCYQSPWVYWKNPIRFFMYVIGTNGLARFRLVGPHAKPEMAEKWLSIFTFPLPHPGTGSALVVKLLWCLGITSGDMVCLMRSHVVEPTLALALPFNQVAPGVLSPYAEKRGKKE